MFDEFSSAGRTAQILSLLDAQHRLDKEWFDRNPGRALFARPMIAAELAVFAAGPTYSVVVARVASSFCRVGVEFPPEATNRLAEMSDCEIIAASPKGGAAPANMNGVAFSTRNRP